MKILITGATGFVGRHLAYDLIRSGHEVILTSLETTEILIKEFGPRPVHRLDITDYRECLKVFEEFKPDGVVQLAGISQTVGHSQEMLERLNVTGARNVAAAFLSMSNALGGRPRSLLFTSSAFVYGGNASSGVIFFDENGETVCRNPYGESKLKAELAIREFDGPHLKVYVTRPFNHIGPGQDRSFVVPALASRIKAAKQGDVIETGNLDSLRDFTDVRDVVRAYRMILEQQPSERLFVIGSGRPTAVQVIFDELIRHSGKSLHHRIADHLKRDEGSAALLADSSLAGRVLGWKPEISIEKSIEDVWREYQ